ncbi:MAG: peptidylprolyl isomerase [Chloroflexi bacterium]|nr:peptidylprolyl isomerase [Chloroflexota bacterium]MDA8188684.1 peptidylprolyl isomerase [Dehalococcoidales bacterium]
MKKSAKKAIKEPERKMTKRQLSRHERERKLTKITIGAGAAVLVLIVFVIAFGLYREVVSKPFQAIAVVNGKEISLGNYAKMLGYADFNLDYQRAQLQDLIDQSNQNSSQGQDQDFTRQFAQQQLQQLDLNKRLLPSQVLDQMIGNELIRQEAARRGLSVTPQEIDDDIVKQASPAPSADASGTVTTTEGVTTTNTPVTKTIAESTQDLSKALAQTGFLTVDEYRSLVVEPALYREKLQKALADEVKPSAEQVHARHILVDTEDQAKEALRKLKDEKADFASLAKEMSKDTGTKDKGGDLGWFPRGVMTQAFEDAAFKMQPGELSEPVHTEFGYHIIQVEERADDRPLSEEQLSQEKAQVLNKWLQEQKAPQANKVQRLDTPELTKWANDFVTNKRKEAVKRAQSAPSKK